MRKRRPVRPVIYPMQEERIGPNAGGLKLEPPAPPPYRVSRKPAARKARKPGRD